MGTGVSTHSENIQSRKIEEQIKDELQRKRKTQKLLLLGAGDSGKSTILKQMRILHTSGFTLEEKRRQKPFIHWNTIEAITTLVDAMKSLEIEYENSNRKEDADAVLTFQRQTKKHFEVCLTLDIVQAIKQLWQDAGMQKCYSRRNEYQLLDSAKFFLNNIERIGAMDYLPTQDDILRCKIKTTGVTEVQFQVNSTLFRVVDVGGQRSERRKWIRCFDDVKSIIFLTSLSEYDQTLEEDQSTVQTLIFPLISVLAYNFRTLTHLESNGGISETLQLGEQRAQESKEFLRNHFLAQNKSPRRQTTYTHFTCATDTSQVSFVINSVIDTLIEENLKAVDL